MKDINELLRNISDLITQYLGDEIEESISKVNESKEIKPNTFYTPEADDPIFEPGRKFKVGSNPCRDCSSYISWELRPERNLPLHVNKDGTIKGNGDCPKKW